jgi:hypothetical protein
MGKIKGVETSRLWDSLESLVAACETAFTCEQTDMMEDADDDVSIPPTGLTFGQIWKARDALNTLREHMPS